MKGIKLLLLTIVSQITFIIDAKVNVGIEVMPQLSSRLSWSGGVNLEIPLSDKIYLSPGIYYSSRHRYDELNEILSEHHSDGDVPISYEKLSIHMHGDYVHIPFMVGLNSLTRDNYSIKTAAGIYYACFLGGKSKIKMDNNGDVSEMIKPSSVTSVGKRSDIGLCVEAKCLLYRHYQIGINLQHGLRKIYDGFNVACHLDPYSNHKLGPGLQFHKSIGLSLGYLF